ncbi:MAG: hypothetical protein HZB53_20925 [Chloroflexi bacterium]|nr:hypothetical protein [Chloroflexota bacterium]
MSSHPLSPADERGLSALSLDSRLRRAFLQLPRGQLADLVRRVHDLSRERSLVYYRESGEEVINVMLCPRGIFPEQSSYYHYATLTIIEALKQVPDLYLQNEAVRTILPLSETEDRWLQELWTPAHSQKHSIFGRLDAMTDLTTPAWKEALEFMEANLTGVGGVHLIPTAESIILDVIAPAIQEVAPELELESLYDLRDLFMQEMRDQAKTIRRHGGAIALVDPKFIMDGPNEQTALQAYYSAQGLPVFHADPTELQLKGDEVLYGGTPVDVCYRDYELRDVIDLESDGVDVRPLKHLFKTNRMISSMAGDFDHKSGFEILTDPNWARYFTPDQQEVFQRHVLWTRLLRETMTTGPEGWPIDLIEYTRRNRERLVIKPNRSYGGAGVHIGCGMEQSEWETVMQAALTDAESGWVVQKIARTNVAEFPVVDDDGEVHMAPFYFVLGFAATKRGLSVLGRASQKQVVNVAQRGGLCTVLVGRHSGPIRPPVMPPRR